MLLVPVDVKKKRGVSSPSLSSAAWAMVAATEAKIKKAVIPGAKEKVLLRHVVLVLLLWICFIYFTIDLSLYCIYILVLSCVFMVYIASTIINVVNITI